MTLAFFAIIAGLAKLRERAEKAEQERVAEWNRRRDADGSRDAARAACDTMRAERDTLTASLAQTNLRARNAYMRGLLDSAQHLRSTIPDNPDTWEQIESMARMMDTMATLEGAADRVLRFITDPDWADQNSEVFRTTPWQTLYNEMRAARDDFPALVRTFLEAFACADFRDELRRAALLPVARDGMEG